MIDISSKRITSITGSPSFVVLFLTKLLELNKKIFINDVWPNLELYVHGAVAIDPYMPILNKILKYKSINYIEVYNSSEGFFGIQDQKDEKDMLLLLDHGIFYEFIP
jgi:hypothetical protein|tara:strand:- start:549 stop:869 length:321 start_codon:yes stop_codon:yes gene_type:complete